MGVIGHLADIASLGRLEVLKQLRVLVLYSLHTLPLLSKRL